MAAILAIALVSIFGVLLERTVVEPPVHYVCDDFSDACGANHHRSSSGVRRHKWVHG